jgi:hypothetical protein
MGDPYAGIITPLTDASLAPAAAGWDRRRRAAAPFWHEAPNPVDCDGNGISGSITAGSAGSGYLEIEELVENSRIHSIY